MYTVAGPEIAVASTKAYTTQVETLMLLIGRMAKVRGIFNDAAEKEYVDNMLQIPAKLKEVLNKKHDIHKIARKLLEAKDAFMLGRGLDYSILLEGALKLKEISYIHTEAYASGELKHGTIALITENVPVIALATQPAVYEKMVSNIREVKARGAYVILISMGDEVTDTQICDKHIRIPKQDSLFTVFAAAVILQLIAYYTSDAKGLDVDKPRNLAKSVTVE